MVWNFIVGAVYVLSVGPAAYGAGKVSAHEQNGASISALLAGWPSRPPASRLGSGITAAARPVGCSAAPPARARHPPEGDDTTPLGAAQLALMIPAG